MSLTGLFLCLFLIGHLSGNLQLLIPGETGQLQFNEYAKFMTTNPAVKILSYLTYLSILFHVIDGIILTRRNRAARPNSYVHATSSKSSIWSSRNMGVLGTIILVFIVLHMGNFWYKMHWVEIGTDANGNKDLHSVVMFAFQELWYVAIYVLSMLAIAYHLLHGFQSAFQTLGINHKKYTPFIQKVGVAFAILIPLAFAIIPVYVYFVF